MKKRPHITLFFLVNFILISAAWSQKKISELTIVYNYTLNNSAAAKPGAPSFSATNTIYIKGNMSRTETVSSLFSSSTIYDGKTGFAVVLREVNGQKLLIRLNPENWRDKNRRYQNLAFAPTAESKVIAGYKCEKATATTADGFLITVYYTKELIPENKDYDPQFKNLDGLPLEYEFAKGTTTIKYTLSSINLNPVPASKFDTPKSGYREMSYDESKKLNIER
ncbi:MAG: hypothetical protein JST75_10330 [Bacteroidetes bacterium]|nr:hypothetical protein [Bacteroidota bacterium]